MGIELVEDIGTLIKKINAEFISKDPFQLIHEFKIPYFFSNWSLPQLPNIGGKEKFTTKYVLIRNMTDYTLTVNFTTQYSELNELTYKTKENFITISNSEPLIKRNNQIIAPGKIIVAAEENNTPYLKKDIKYFSFLPNQNRPENQSWPIEVFHK